MPHLKRPSGWALEVSLATNVVCYGFQWVSSLMPINPCWNFQDTSKWKTLMLNDSLICRPLHTAYALYSILIHQSSPSTASQLINSPILTYLAPAGSVAPPRGLSWEKGMFFPFPQGKPHPSNESLLALLPEVREKQTQVSPAQSGAQDLVDGGILSSLVLPLPTSSHPRNIYWSTGGLFSWRWGQVHIGTRPCFMARLWHFSLAVHMHCRR